MIEGVILTPLKKICGDKGSVFHGIKSSDKGYAGFGEAYFSTVNYGDIKSWRKHKKMTLNLIVPVGEIKFVLYDSRISGKSRGRTFSVIIGDGNYCRLTIPPQVWMAFEGVGKGLNLLLDVANFEHDPEEEERAEIEEFPYE
ncbi:MAG: dTDP-4-dehydrorhamnose 3,5-epimerase [Bacteroidales bacterium]|jgi:dTDP-4-dehydrorhamnose 3,5-epimerase|nr:dTDP-4-dehydrorhamnose 3,5-epimerase [Bacteroidales bacterium]